MSQGGVVLVFALALLAPPATAGTVVVETRVAAEIAVDGRPVAQTFGPARLELLDVPAGTRVFAVLRGGTATRVPVEVPEDGAVRLLVGDDAISTDRPPPAVPVPADAPPPRLELRVEPGERVAVLLDGQRRAVVGAGQPVVLDDVGPGAHALEVRSADLSLVWARGTLDLRPGDRVVLHLAEGRMPEAFGREGAWRPGG